MSAAGVTDALVEAIAGDTYDLIVANFANPDMVGHTGVWDGDGRAPSRRSMPASGGSSPRSTAHDAGRTPDGPGSLLAITADHGNADQMRDADGQSRHRPLAEPGPVPARRAARSRAGRCATASSPTSRRRCASWPACRAGPG